MLAMPLPRGCLAARIGAVVSMSAMRQRHAAVVAYRITRELQVPFAPPLSAGIRTVACSGLAQEFNAAELTDVSRHGAASIERPHETGARVLAQYQASTCSREANSLLGDDTGNTEARRSEMATRGRYTLKRGVGVLQGSILDNGLLPACMPAEETHSYWEVSEPGFANCQAGRSAVPAMLKPVAFRTIS
jgi:hypothetical protein